VLHAVGHAFQDGTSINLSGWDPSRAKNLFAGHTVYSIVLEVPDEELLADAGDKRRIGAWAVSTLATDAGGWRSINRVGLPMIHPLFTQYNEDLGNRLNAGCPGDDYATHGATQSNCGRRRSKWNSRRSSGLWGDSRTPSLPQHPSLRGRYTRCVRIRTMERSLTYRQRARCHVLYGGERSRTPRDREGVGYLETVEDVSIRSRCK
jgi:hypothetical protein